MGIGKSFGRLPRGEPASPINAAMMGAFANHGVDCSQRGGWITFPNGMRAAGEIDNSQPLGDGVSVQLDVYLEIEPDRVIIESFAGGGPTAAHAVSNAMNCFAVHSFHVFLAAFFDKFDEQQVEREEWEISGRERRVTIGPMGIRGKPPTEGEQGQKLTACFDRIWAALKSHPFTSGTHWVRIFYAQEAGRLIACEVLRDNETWESLQSVTATLEWPTSKGFYSVRRFLTIQDR
jgi:hypothetical protein